MIKWNLFGTSLVSQDKNMIITSLPFSTKDGKEMPTHKFKLRVRSTNETIMDENLQIVVNNANSIAKRDSYNPDFKTQAVKKIMKKNVSQQIERAKNERG